MKRSAAVAALAQRARKVNKALLKMSNGYKKTAPRGCFFSLSSWAAQPLIRRARNQPHLDIPFICSRVNQ
jgi:hypothetical protein